jgi:hypothetical protein
MGSNSHTANVDHKTSIDVETPAEESIKKVSNETEVQGDEELLRKFVVVEPESTARKAQKSRLNPNAPPFIPQSLPQTTDSNFNWIRHPLPQRPPPPIHPEPCPAWGCRRYEPGGCPCGMGREQSQYPRGSMRGRRRRRQRVRPGRNMKVLPPPEHPNFSGYEGPIEVRPGCNMNVLPPLAAEHLTFSGYRGPLPPVHYLPAFMVPDVIRVQYPPLQPQFFSPPLQSPQLVSAPETQHPVFVDPAVTMVVDQGRAIVSPSPPYSFEGMDDEGVWF